MDYMYNQGMVDLLLSTVAVDRVALKLNEIKAPVTSGFWLEVICTMDFASSPGISCVSVPFFCNYIESVQCFMFSHCVHFQNEILRVIFDRWERYHHHWKSFKQTWI